MARVSLEEAIGCLIEVAQKGRSRQNLQMSGDPHYQPRQLQPYLGYDQRAGWLVIAEWFWLLALAEHKIIPPEDAVSLSMENLRPLLYHITTTRVTQLERSKVGHDILALLALMRRYLPKSLHRWLHFGTTSYDTICTAYALQARETFKQIVYPKAQELDRLWRDRIALTGAKLQMGRTHLQDALPVTVGCWLSVLHNRFASNTSNALLLSHKILGKFSGAVGTRAAMRALLPDGVEATALELLELPLAELSTQVTKPESLERFYNEIMLVSAALANLGDDVRHLQASAIAEVISASSTSSTMSHKQANPVAAEQVDGMHISVRCEFYKVVETLNSTLQRDLRWSNVMRGFTGILVLD